MRYWKLISGFVDIAVCLFIGFQSCATLIISEDGDLSPSVGFLVGFMVLAIAVVNISTKNSKKEGNKIVIALSIIGCIIAWAVGGAYTDLEVWGFWLLIHAAVAILGLVSDKEEK